MGSWGCRQPGRLQCQALQPIMLRVDTGLSWWLCAGCSRSKPCAHPCCVESQLPADRDKVPNHVDLEVVCPLAEDRVRSHTPGPSLLPALLSLLWAGMGWRQCSLCRWHETGGSGN